MGIAAQRRGTIASASSVAALTYSQEVLADSPLLYWRLGEASGTTAADASGNGRTGTYAGSGVTYSATGAVAGNNAITTNGSAGYIQSTASLDLTALSAVTVEMWVNLSAYSNDFKMLMESSPGDGSAGSIWICPNDSNGRISIVKFQSSSPTSQYARSDISAGAYHHWVIQYSSSGSVPTLRVDKVTLTPFLTSGSTAGAFTNAKLNFAARDASGLFLAATIDEIAVYGSALSTARTDAHYDARNI